MDFIILAAGLGTRAKCDNTRQPKVLLEAPNGRSLLVNTLEQIRLYAEGHSIRVVMGYRHQLIEDEISDFLNTHVVMPSIELVHNQIYERGVITSLACGIRELNQDITILNGDTVYSPEVFQTLVNLRESTLLGTEQNQDPDSVKIMTTGNRILNVGKQLTNYSHTSIGCLFLTKHHAAIIQNYVEDLIEHHEDGKKIWHQVINHLVDLGEVVQFQVMPTGCAFEIDTQNDYQDLFRKNIHKNLLDS